METTELLDCGHAPSAHESFTNGYGITADGKRHCYECCADADRASMIETGCATLYLVGSATGSEVTNWPGSLRFQCHYTRHSKRGGGFGSQRTDAWFTGPDGKVWHAINRGDMDVAQCRRLKVQP
jgi:hypothetical protein